MDKMIHMSECELVSARAGTAGENDSLAKDIGQYIGGFYGAYVDNPFLSFLPYFGGLYANYRGLVAAGN